ncbi:TonB-dependent receptor [Mucilaginibacter ginsenosidivorax]|uniref:TonB-dependent receptor n=1 Tax=Mucilaginibacter ginsenosidivorax TaxID=862126 RepID=A0A5B8VZE4_9SPHI|nr:TonB-dependent receptor [Mucilaginibacter ginsenosidivorax]QEC76711.1 TonB-dependent receptor [Mucilaginibacter ginsenosidivorax]
MARKIYLFLVVISLFPAFAFAQNATISGVVLNGLSKEPLPGAYVHLDGTDKGANTDGQGKFSITNLAAGQYKIKLSYVGFIKFEKRVTLSAGQALNLSIALTESLNNLETVKVYGKLATETEAAARSNEKNSNNIKNVVSAKAIEKSPDINAANVLQRVSGVTIQRNAGGDDAYAIIRGLEPRYNNTLINGIKIASPSSKTRLVSLSVVPSDMLARIEVDKTLLPDMEGDAIGGTVNLVFKDAPEKREISATAALGYNQLFIDRKFLQFSTSDIKKYSPSESNGANYVAQPNDFTRSNLDFKNVSPPPTGTIGFTYGERLFKKKLGLIVSDSYQNIYFGSNTEGNDGNADPADPDHRPRINNIYNRSISSHELLNNFNTHLDYKINDKNKITLDNVFIYTRLAEASVTADTSITGGNGGRTVPGTGPVNTVYQSTLTSQYIENLKIAGDHILDKHFQVNWYGAFSDAFVRTPDQADINTNLLITYDPATRVYTKTPNYFDNIDRIWAHNNDKDYNGAANISYKTFFSNSALVLKAGGLYRHKTRYNYEDEYILRPVPDANGGKPTFTDINSAQWNVYTPLGAGDFNINNYNAFENITAYYGEFKLSLPRLDIFGGVRTEVTSQGYHVRQDVTNASDVNKNYTDVLPSISFKYILNDKTNLRLAYFSSIARPAYYELVPTSPPSTGGTTITGNPDLKHTTSNNFDLRYELFPKADEQFFVGLYYKQLTNPIEYSYSSNSGANSIFKPQNPPSATVAGFEVAYTQFWGNYGVSGNYAYNHSDVASNKIDRNNPSVNGNPNIVIEHRMLTGAAVHDLNLSFLYRNTRARLNAQVAYQYLGKTLVATYPNNGDNYIQQPLSTLAFSADKAIGKHFTVFTKLNNLLNTHTTVVLHNFQNGNQVTKASYLAGLRYNY